MARTIPLRPGVAGVGLGYAEVAVGGQPGDCQEELVALVGTGLLDLTLVYEQNALIPCRSRRRIHQSENLTLPINQSPRGSGVSVVA